MRSRFNESYQSSDPPASSLSVLRPGWKEFLRDSATKYEMHVYTMGTRAYAEEVCAAIDPDGSIFGGRLLSRDESGSAYNYQIIITALIYLLH